MQLSIYKDYETLSLQAANDIVELVRHKPDAVLCLAAGETPRLTYTLMVKNATDRKIDFSRCTFIGLDEWVGVPPSNEGSCHYFLQKNVFEPLEISPNAIHLFDALSADLDHQCSSINRIISDKGGIDLMIVGIGMNGHIGFNEPGIPFDRYAHVVDLDEATQSVGQKYFAEKTSLPRGITLGLNHLMESGQVILMANGLKKAELIRKALEGDISPTLPASIIRRHPDGRVMLDEGAASALNSRRHTNVPLL